MFKKGLKMGNPNGKLLFISERARLAHCRFMLVYGEDMDGEVLTLEAFEFLINDPFYDRIIYTAFMVTEDEVRGMGKEVIDEEK